MLPELQAALAAQIRLGVATPGGAAPPPGLLATPQRLHIHQRHVRTSLTAVLRGRFPAVVKLVGDGFFAFLAAQFIAGHPPTDPRVARYGDGLADFLAGFEAARDYPWLPDVARIENAAAVVAEAPVQAPLDPARLTSVAPDQAADLTFTWNDAVRLVSSDLPAALLWRVAREGGLDTRIDMENAGPTRLLVCRVGDAIKARDLPAPDFAFRRALADGHSLGEAVVAAGADFDLAAAFAALLGDGCVTDFSLERVLP